MQLSTMEETKVVNELNQALSDIKKPKGISFLHLTEVIVGGDSGKRLTKVTIFFKKPDGEWVKDSIDFPTTMKRSDSEMAVDGVYEVFIDGQRYLIGDNSETMNLAERDKRSKALTLHRNCILTGIALLLKKHNVTTDEVKLAVNMTLNDFTNLREREEIARLYGTKINKMKIKLGKKEYQFKIKLLPYYEGMGAILEAKEKFKNKRVVSLDFGSYNVGFATFENMKVIRDKSGTMDKGVTKFLAKAKTILSNHGYNTITSESQIIEVVEEKNNHVSKEVVQMIHNEAINFLTEVQYDLSRLDVDTNFSPLVISGGGGIMFKKFIPTVFQQASKKQSIHFADNPKYANSVGSINLFAK